ncbi:hypothetical protein HJD18_01720 [Thermoleophilia bacterium SCSIO 60948]|nr:hypothetical protein HJD18_01720 [Thermoleophilia bacterium SCSIO 60948]
MTSSARRRLPQALLAIVACVLATLGLGLASAVGGPASPVVPTGTTGPGPDPDPELTARPGKGREGDRGTRVVRVKLRLSAPMAADGDVTYKLVPGSAKRGKDFKGRGGKVRLRAGQTKAKLPVKVRGDRRHERKRERLGVKLTKSSGVTIVRSRSSVTIIDDD